MNFYYFRMKKMMQDFVSQDKVKEKNVKDKYVSLLCETPRHIDFELTQPHSKTLLSCYCTCHDASG